MVQVQTASYVESNAWKKIFLILSVCIIVILPILSKDYGKSGDEWLQIEYGHDIWNYFFHGDKQALDYSNKSLQYQGQELYGGAFDFSTEILHHWLPGINQIDLRHFCNALLNAIMMIFTGLFAYRISKKWSVGTLALLFILFSPRIFGEGMNNPKDIPHACGFTLGLYGLYALLEDFPKKKWRHAIILMLGLALAFGVRPAGGILLIAYLFFFAGLYYFLNKGFKESLKNDNNRLLKNFVLVFGVAVVGGYAIGLLGWPWGIESPISHSIATVKGMTNRDIVLRVLFEGEYHYNNNMPWYYEFKWICMSNPIVIISGVVMFIILSLKAKKEYGLFAVGFLLFSAFFPLLYMIYKHSSVHDTWRHVFFVYVYWVIIGALGWDLISGYVKNASKRWIVIIVAVLGLIPAMYWTVYSHPNQYVYFNELVGGIKGAYGFYDIDYYQNSNKQEAIWFLENIKPIPGRKLIVLSDMNGFENYFAKDTSWISYAYGRYGERSQKDWDYYIDMPRFISAEQLQNGHWPPENTIHTVSVDGVPLTAIIQRKSKASIPAFDSFQKKNYAAAAALYAEYLKSDTTDENVYFYYGISLASIGQIDAGIVAMKRATDLDPSQAQFFEILAKLYDAKGDKASAQNAMSRAQSIAERQQELQGDKPEE